MKQRNKKNKSVGNQWEIFKYTFKYLSLNKRMAHSINSIKFLSCCIRWLDLENLSLRERKSERERVSEREIMYIMQENLMGMGNG